MEETEKMTALKKAYAEIILNTAKEAAARIIVSERRAQLFQRDLSATKEEALRIMLRIKQMIDLKMNEDETKSLIQRKRIDELEAQLHEAEDIVSNLRADLYEAQSELDKLSRNQQRPLDSQSHHPEETAQADATNGQQNNPKNHRTSENGHASSCHGEDADKTDVTPTIIRSRKPGLYRNGYTQRIRACDRKLLNGHLSPSEEPDDDRKSEELNEADKGGYRSQFEERSAVNGSETTKDSNAHSRLKRKRAMRQKRNITLVASETSIPYTSGSTNYSHNEISNSSKANQDRGLEGRAPAIETHNVTDNDLEVADALVLITQENPTSSPEKSNAQVSDPSDIQSPKSRIVKYTFQRKRRRESNQSISVGDIDSSPQKKIHMQTTGKEQVAQRQS